MHQRIRTATIGTAFSLLVLLFSAGYPQTARVTESLRTFRTYPYGDPDPIPRMSNIYPYYRFQGYSSTPVDKSWKIITLENPYLSVWIAPEIGGKILGAIEKSTGKAFIYFNRVVKFREIAMRGPWTSGGIEFNFGDIGHTPATASPVDYLTKRNADGSVSCFVGSLDLPSRTEWRVEIRLPKDKAYVETRSLWYNPTCLSTSLYHWMNAAVDADSDLQLIYPGTGFIGHGGEYACWPVDEYGHNLSLYRENAFGSYKSYHVLGIVTDFYAARWKESDFGVVHWAPYSDKPGKKIWIWGLSREGEIWREMLTDPDLGNKQYVEIQSGLLFNQAAASSSSSPFKHVGFAPESAERFSEAWFPFVNLGGVVEANLHGALNVQQRGTILHVEFCPLERIDSDLRVTSDGKPLYRRPLHLQPLQTFRDSLRCPENADPVVTIGDLIAYRADDPLRRPLARPVMAPAGFDWHTPFGLYLEGMELSRQRRYLDARTKFADCLSRDSTFGPAWAAQAELLYRSMEYADALMSARRALAVDAYDPDANFIYGVVNRHQGAFSDAVDGFSVAARSMKYRSAAAAALAELFLSQSRYAQSSIWARKCLDYDRKNIRALQVLALAARLRGERREATETLKTLLRIDPLNHFARWEEFRLDPSPRTKRQFAQYIRGELPHETYLELASFYRELGLDTEALSVLAEGPVTAISAYWGAYLSAKEGKLERSAQLLREAQGKPLGLEFPHRADDEEPLLWAEGRQPQWKTEYALALLYWSKGRIDQASHYFDACTDAPDDGSFYIARGDFRRERNPEAALGDYRKALEIAPLQWRCYTSLTDFLNDRGEYRGALEIARRGAAAFPRLYALQFAFARTFLFNTDSRGALSILDTLRILPFEGARYGHEAYRSASLLEAARSLALRHSSEALSLVDQARAWPERLGGGKPYEVDERLEDFVEAMAYDQMGNSAAQRVALQRIVSWTRHRPSDASPYRLVSAMALHAQGDDTAGRELLRTWPDTGSELGHWASIMYTGSWTEARGLEEQLRATMLHRARGNQDWVLLADIIHNLVAGGVNPLSLRGDELK